MLMRLSAVAATTAAVAATLAAGAAAPASATTGVDPLQKVSVRITDKGISVSPKRVARAVTVWFRVVNDGTKEHDFRVAGLKTKPLKHGQVDHIVMSFEDRGAFAYRCVLNCGRGSSGSISVFSTVGGQ